MKYTLTILLFLLCFSVLAQEFTEPIEVSLEDVQNANKRVTKELDKLNKQLRKKLGKQYPDFTVDQLDSSRRRWCYHQQRLQNPPPPRTSAPPPKEDS